MATVDSNVFRTRQTPLPPAPKKEEPRFHRIEEVRKRQGLSLRSASRQTGTDTRELREQEKPGSDIRLSELFRWQSVLGVPIAELLADPEATLSEPILRRAQLVRVMKSVRALGEIATNQNVQRIVETLTVQLTEIMPELEDVGAWHSVGQRRSLDEYGRAAERLMSEESLFRD